MKIFKFNWAKALMMMVLMLGMIACSKDDDPNNPNVPDNSVPDPPGTITANIAENASIEIRSGGYGMGYIRWDTPDNFYLDYYSYSYYSYYYVSICNLGAMKGLGNITSIPSTGFTLPAYRDYSVACEVGHGYVVKFELQQKYVDNPAYDDYPEVVYVRLYVVESIINTGGGIMGAKVKYQYPFVP
jgi:hypothetical protein